MGLRAAAVVSIFLLSLSFFITLSSAKSCPGNCSSHGTCNTTTGACICTQGWSGLDCSVQLTSIRNGTTVSGSVPWRQFVYYVFQVQGSPFEVDFNVNQTSNSTGDCDFYLKSGSPPNRYTYDKRDVSQKSSSSLTVTNFTSNRIYYGIYAFTSGCQYSLVVVQTQSGSNSCPNNCNGHGTCSPGRANGTYVCVCDPGYSGENCSQTYQTLSSTPLTNQAVNKTQWIYYSYTVPDTNNFLDIVVNQTGAQGGDCDLYVKQDSLPTTLSYDYHEITSETNFDLPISNIDPGQYYIGVFGFSACRFSIYAVANSQCPNQCSGHGSCSNGNTCRCIAGYSGVMCETKIAPLGTGELARGYTAQVFNYYKYKAFSDAQLVVMLNETGNNDDCDLYAREGSQPTRSSFDYRDISARGSTTLMNIPDPGDDYWWFGVYGYSTCSYVISVLVSGDCPKNCSGHGACGPNGMCACRAGWAGVDCSIQATPLTNGAPVSNAVTESNWDYYYLEVNTSSITINLHETGETTGAVWLYVRAGTFPTLQNFDASNKDSSSAYHVIHLNFPEQIQDTFFIGIYGNGGDVEADFDLVVWATPF